MTGVRIIVVLIYHVSYLKIVFTYYSQVSVMERQIYSKLFKHEYTNNKQTEKRSLELRTVIFSEELSASPSEGRIHYLGGVGVAIVPGNRRPASRRDRCRSRTHARRHAASSILSRCEDYRLCLSSW